MTVTYASGQPVTVTKTNYVNVNPPKCPVPDFTGQSTTAAPGLWSGAGFSGAIAYKQGGLPWIVQSQSLTGGSPVVCTSPIRLSKTSTP